ncbi:MAG: glycoside hydrolase family 32 protein [Ardenticatenales bacterium]|nr:glycoside hydrolase family 32 protein [Ardenticatenales bacterium]
MTDTLTSAPTRLPYDEPFRPQYHFSPAQNWMNDPNGMVYYAGEYHLFYQYHPHDIVWGPMHWGHAVSTDMVNWQHLPIALYPDEIGTIFSGSAVIDWHNTAGFGSEAMVAIFTHHSEHLGQCQSLAYSLDKGRSWTKYEGNPVIPNPPDIRDFRDPKVFWYGTGEMEGHWVMALAAGSAILFYTSPDLKNWAASGSFGYGYGSTEGVWETPDLFELPIDGGANRRWVLTVGVGDGAPAGGSGMQYFIGQFDGQTFTSDNPKETTLWADYGADFYAAQSWSNTPDGRRLWLAWMSNWPYSNKTPTSPWRSNMSLPRVVGLTQTAAGIRLTQQPVSELATLRQASHSWHNIEIAADAGWQPEVSGELLEIMAEFVPAPAVSSFGLHVRLGDGEQTTLSYEPENQTLAVDRVASGVSTFCEDFAVVNSVHVAMIDGHLWLHLFVDRSSLELFVHDGSICFSELIFPAETSRALAFFSRGGVTTLARLDIYEIDNAAFYAAP